MKIRRVLVIPKKTAVERARRSRAADERAVLARLERGDDTTRLLALEAHEHAGSLAQVIETLEARGITWVRHPIGRPLPSGRFDLVVTVGGDGTLLETSHFLRGRVPVLGVNSAPTTSVGFLTTCRAPQFGRMLDRLVDEALEPVVVHRLRVWIDDEEIDEPVLNDVLFTHASPAQTTRYVLRAPGVEEYQRSSGLWIAAPAGTTAALRSAGGESLPLDAARFAYRVREPYAPPGRRVRTAGGRLEARQTLSLVCQVPSAMLFVDGAHHTYRVPFGAEVRFRLSAPPLRLVRG